MGREWVNECKEESFVRGWIKPTTDDRSIGTDCDKREECHGTTIEARIIQKRSKRKLSGFCGGLLLGFGFDFVNSFPPSNLPFLPLMLIWLLLIGALGPRPLSHPPNVAPTTPRMIMVRFDLLNRIEIVGLIIRIEIEICMSLS